MSLNSHVLLQVRLDPGLKIGLPYPFLGSSSFHWPPMWLTQWLKQYLALLLLTTVSLHYQQKSLLIIRVMRIIKMYLRTIFHLWYWQTIKSFPGLWVEKWCSSRLALSSPPPLCPGRQATWATSTDSLALCHLVEVSPVGDWREEWFEAFIPLAPCNGAILGWLHPSLSTQLSSSMSTNCSLPLLLQAQGEWQPPSHQPWGYCTILCKQSCY